MMTDNSQNNHKPKVRAKAVTLRNIGPARWECEFEGVVTRRDIHRISRILKVEFARAQRRYSVQRKKAIQEALIAESKDVSIPTPKKVTAEKVQTKEIVQNG